MNRYFAALGLSEDATKQQVKQAYEHRAGKYKSADYADDPDYVRHKLAELKEAYEIAYKQAETEAASAADSMAREQYRPVSRQKEYDQDRPAGRKKIHLQKPNLSTLKTTLTREETSQNKNAPFGGKVLVSILITVFIILVSMMPTMCSTNIDIVDDMEYVSERDAAVNETTTAIGVVTDSMAYDSYTPEKTSEAVIQKQADQFAKNYFEMNTFRELVEYLNANYENFWINFETDGLEKQITETLDFFQFPQFSEISGYADPYNDGRAINSLAAYLEFLNEYYQENGLS